MAINTGSSPWVQDLQNNPDAQAQVSGNPSYSPGFVAQVYGGQQAAPQTAAQQQGIGPGGSTGTSMAELMARAQEQANFTGQPVPVKPPFGISGGTQTVYPNNTTAKMQSMATGGSVGGPSSSGGYSSFPVQGNATPSTNLTPWDQQRGAAATQLAGTMNPSNDPSNVYRDKMSQMVNGQFSPDDPSYQFRLQQGQQTLERSLGARGLLQSGNAGAELQAYGQNTASTEYGAQFARLVQGLSGVESQYNTQQQRLMTMAGVGADPTASGTLGVAQTNAATNQAQVGVNQQKVSNDFTAQMAGVANNSGNIWANIWK